jgi:hypothetical protein
MNDVDFGDQCIYLCTQLSAPQGQSTALPGHPEQTPSDVPFLVPLEATFTIASKPVRTASGRRSPSLRALRGLGTVPVAYVGGALGDSADDDGKTRRSGTRCVPSMRDGPTCQDVIPHQRPGPHHRGRARFNGDPAHPAGPAEGTKRHRSAVDTALPSKKNLPILRPSMSVFASAPAQEGRAMISTRVRRP